MASARRVLARKAFLWLAVAALCAPACTGQQATGQQLLEPSVLAEGLEQPLAVAVRPGQGSRKEQVAVAEFGAGRVVLWRMVDRQTQTIIPSPPEAIPQAGPTALAFFNSKVLAVAWGSQEGELAGVATYQITASGTTEQQTFDRPPQTNKAVGAALRGFHRVKRYLYAVSSVEDRVQLWRANFVSGKLGPLRQVGEAQGRAGALCVSVRGYLLSAVDGSADFLDTSGRTPFVSRLSLRTGLHSPQAVLYSPLVRPSAKRLYALEGSEAPPEKQGLYRLDAQLTEGNRMGCQATRVSNIQDGVAMDFGFKGTLYIASRGNGSDGKLLKVEGNL